MLVLECRLPYSTVLYCLYCIYAVSRYQFYNIPLSAADNKRFALFSCAMSILIMYTVVICIKAEDIRTPMKVMLLRCSYIVTLYYMSI